VETIALRQVTKEYAVARGRLKVLDGITFDICSGTFNGHS
jgi:hypothetical protein